MFSRFPVALCAIVLGICLLLPSVASAATYDDATGENFTGSPGFLDIDSVEVTNDASTITFKIASASSFAAPNDWGKFLIGVDSVAGGKTDNGTRWDPARPINMPSGMDYWVDNWLTFGGGAQVWKYDPANPSAANGFDPTSTGSATSVIDATNTSIALTFPLSAFGLQSGGTFSFDVWGTGGGADSAYDSLRDQDVAAPTWSGPYSATELNSYTVVVPEPGTLGLAGIALLAVARRRSRD
ncbi:MAG TPA: PEP-CTERM sorting domain-containing protein [Tepidisphaeraceae bacterium]|nr:PEP-CTERM sorting domain-containing protein [Tepidisphaeraceae bacterium]